MSAGGLSRREKIRLIFDLFDADGDGGLCRQELAALVAAVNPSVHLTADQISSILDEVFLSYSDFVPSPNSGLTLAGLIQTYDDGAGDVELDFAALFVDPNNPNPNPVIPNPNDASRIGPAWVSSPNHGIKYESTWKVVEELEIIIRARFRTPKPKILIKDAIFFDGFSDNGWSSDMTWDARDERSPEFRAFLKELREMRAGIDQMPTPEEAFDAYMAMGRTLHDRKFYAEAIGCFRRAVEIRPTDLRPRYRLGNSLIALKRPAEAKECYSVALKLGEIDPVRWSDLLPQVLINFGIVMEGEGLLINASEHYREAAILCPTHYRALKLLGSALFAVGEYGPAERALEEAVLLKPDFADAHCDLGSVLHEMEQDDKAVLAFQRAIDLKSDHLDALYNLGGLFKDMGRYGRASEMYGRVLAVRPDHWRAQLNRAVSLLGAEEVEEAEKALQEAFKMTNRVELYNAIQNLKHSQRKSRGVVNWVSVEMSKFKTADKKTTTVRQLLDALWVRELQKVTKLCRCNVSLLKKEMDRIDVQAFGGNRVGERSIRKADLEIILRRLLDYMKPEAFQGAVKALDVKIWSVLDVTGSGRVDIGMFFAIIAPICEGSPKQRKRAAFDALLWRPANEEVKVKSQIVKADAAVYWRYLRVIYFPLQGFTNLMGINGGEEQDTGVSFPEFTERFDDTDCGFGVMSTLVKLESGDRVRQSRHSCGVCRYRITGLMFKETTSGFYLCPSCYSECKVPSAFAKEDYEFKECTIP